MALLAGVEETWRGGETDHGGGLVDRHEARPESVIAR